MGDIMLTIRQRQADLQFLNYDCGGVDGIEGPKTKKAYYYFQRDFNCSILNRFICRRNKHKFN